jgi:hypothetical protein
MRTKSIIKGRLSSRDSNVEGCFQGEVEANPKGTQDLQEARGRIQREGGQRDNFFAAPSLYNS